MRPPSNTAGFADASLRKSLGGWGNSDRSIRSCSVQLLLLGSLFARTLLTESGRAILPRFGSAFMGLGPLGVGLLAADGTDAARVGLGIGGVGSLDMYRMETGGALRSVCTAASRWPDAAL